MKTFFAQLYGDIDDLCNSRIIDELDYYMYEVRNKEEMIYYFTKEQTIFMVVSDTWSIEKLYTLYRTALRENCFMIIPLDCYTSYMSKTVGDNLKEESKKFFDNPKAYRLAAGRGNKLSKLLSRIKRIATPKTN